MLSTPKTALLPVLAMLIFSTSPAVAADWYVSTTGSDADPGNEALPFATFSKVAAVVQPGDVVHVAAGSYAERLEPTSSGTSQEPIVWRASTPGGVVISGVPECILVVARDHLRFDGIDCIGSSPAPATSIHTGVVIAGATDVIVENATIRNTTHHGIALSSGTRESILRNNVIDHIGEPTTSESGVGEAISLSESTSNLVEGNVLGFAGHNLIRISESPKNVIRGNRLGNPWWRALQVDGDGDPGDPEDGSVQNVIEDNRVFGGLAPPDAGTSPPPAVQLSSPRTIFRRNLIWDNQQSALRISGLAQSPDASGSRIYHNVLWRNGLVGLELVDGGAAVDMGDQRIVNNVMLQSGWVHEFGYDLGSTQLSLSSPDLLDGATFFHNAIRDDEAAETVIEVEGILRGPVWWYEENHGYAFWGNSSALPGYTDPAGGDFSIPEASPVIDAGAFLTETTEAGSGFSLRVADPAFFSDGAGVQDGDVIQLEGQTRRARVCSVDRAGGTLRLSHRLSWSAEQGVALAYTGSAPDLGHEEHGLELELRSCGSGGGSGGGGGRCGIGFEVGPLLAGLLALRRRFRPAARAAPSGTVRGSRG